MTATALRVALVVAASAGAFYAGRAWPTSTPPRAGGVASSAVPPAPPGAPSIASAAPTPRGPALPPLVAGAEVSDDFVRAVRDDPDAAARLRSDVVVAFDARRRQHNPALRACLDSGAMVEETQIRFSVEVSAHEHQLEVGPAVMAEVVEGPALTDATLTSLLAALDQRATVDLGRDQAVIAYDGPIDVPVRFAPARAGQP